MKNNNSQVTCYQIGDLTLDTQRGSVTRANTLIALPKLSYDLLVALATAAPALLSQQELMQKVWPERVIGDETLKQRIKLLRKALNDDANAPRYIEAVRGRGYRLLPEVKRAFIAKQPPAVMLDLTANDLFPSLSSHQFSRTWRRFSWAVLSLFIIVLFALAIQGPSIKSAPVEPLVNIPVEQSLKESSQPLSQAQLYYQRGREYYHRYHQADNEIAMDFFKKAIAAQHDFANAYAALSQAHSQQFYQFAGTGKDIAMAVDYAYQALAIDGQSANAYKALGTAFYVSGWLAKSIDVLLQAQEIAEQDKEVLSALAFIYSQKGQYSKALQWHKKVIELHPDYALAHAHLGQTFLRLQQYDIALKWLKRSLSLQPDYMPAIISLASVYRKQGHLAQAEHMLRLAMDKYPQQSILYQALAEHYFYVAKPLQGDEMIEVATTLYQKPLSLTDVVQVIRTDDAEQLKALVKQLTERQQKGNSYANNSLALAGAYIKLGQEKVATRYLVQAFQQGMALNNDALQHSLFGTIRRTTTYESILAQYQQKLAGVASFSVIAP